jgi:hypothetical protein
MNVGKRFLQRLSEEVGEERAKAAIERLADLICPIVRAADAVITARMDELTSDLYSRIDSYQHRVEALEVYVVEMTSDRLRHRKRRYVIPHDILFGDGDLRAWRDAQDARAHRDA